MVELLQYYTDLANRITMHDSHVSVPLHTIRKPHLRRPYVKDSDDILHKRNP
jgi:hypothetical protein